MASKGQKFNSYTEEQKNEILQKYLSGIPSLRLAQEYGISSTTIRNWKHKYLNLEKYPGLGQGRGRKKEKDFSEEFYLYFDNGLDYFVDDDKNEETYKEVKYSGFDGYMYQCDDYEYEICLYLGEKDDYDAYLFAYVAPGSDLIDTETTNMEEIFNQKEVQDILNSIKFKGIKEVKPE